MTMMATDHDDQLGEIHPTMSNEINWTFGISFMFLLLWPAWSWFVADMVVAIWFVAIMV